MDDELFQKLGGEGDVPVVERDSNTFLTTEYAERLGCSPKWAREKLTALKRAGKLEAVRVKQENGSIPGWRLKA